MKKTGICVVGGGAAGLCAAISAKRNGADVLIVERLPRVGKKILATGNGRCNITNANITYDNYHGDSDFAAGVLSACDRDAALDFLGSMGIVCTEGENGKMYPRSLQATSVLDLLRAEVERCNIETVTEFFVQKIEKKGAEFILTSENGQISAEKVILACGGYAAPSFGTDGIGATIAKSMGHTVTPVYPALVQLKTENVPKALKGVKHFCMAHLYIEGKKVRSKWGEVLFTEYGLSGPPIFDLSRDASAAVAEKKKTEISLELLPEDFGTLRAMLEKRRKDFPDLAGENFLNSIIHKKIGFEIVKKTSDIKEIASLIKNWRHRVTGTMGFKNAQVTAGGVKCSEVYPETLMSRKVKDLYFAGEILDIDGDCGGYNLQWAWSSGIIAGESAARC